MDRLGKAEVDDFSGNGASILKAHHDVAWFDVPMNELLFVHRSQTGGDLGRNFQCEFHIKPAGTFDQTLQRLAFHKFHGVEVVRTASPKVKYRGDVGMVKAGCRPGLTQKSTASRFFADISFVNDLQGYGTPEIDIQRFVGNPHGPTTQLYWCTALVDHQFIVLKPAGTRGRPSLFEANPVSFCPGRRTFDYQKAYNISQIIRVRKKLSELQEMQRAAA